MNISEIYVSMYLIYVNRQSHLGLSNSIASGGTSFESTSSWHGELVDASNDVDGNLAHSDLKDLVFINMDGT